MAFIEEFGLKSPIKLSDGLRDRLGIARIVKIERCGDVYFRCRICQRDFNTSYWSKEEYHDHVRSCKRTHYAVQKIRRSDPIKIRHAIDRFNAIHEDITNRSHLYVQQNESYASGIGEFASNITTFLGSHIIRILEGGLTLYKIDTISSLYSSLCGRENREVARDLLQNPNAHFISSINDILLIHNGQSRYNTTKLLHTLGDLIWVCVMSDLVTSNIGSSGGDGSLLINPKIFKQLLAIARSLANSNNNDMNARYLTYDNLVIISIHCGCTDTLGKEIESDYRRKLYNTRKCTFDFSKAPHRRDLAQLLYENEDGLLLFFPAIQKRVSSLGFGWQRYLRREIAFQLYRKHIDRIYAPDKYYGPNFGIMSYIGPYLVTVDCDEEEIRSSIENLTQKFLSAMIKYLKSGYGFQVKAFGDFFEVVSLLERSNYNTEVWDSTKSQWLTKDSPYFKFFGNKIPLTRYYWYTLQWFRVASKIEEYSGKLRDILNNPLVLKQLAEWLGMSCLETYGLAWEDLDPDSNWDDGFWHAPNPPESIEMKYVEYCANHRRWRTIMDVFRLNVEFEKLYGSTQKLCKTEAGDNWRCYNREVDVLERDDSCRCRDFDPVYDWRLYLQWEEKEAIIKDMIKENLQKTRPDIINGDNIAARDVLGSSIQRSDTSDTSVSDTINEVDIATHSVFGSSTQDTYTSDADIDTADDEVIRALEVFRIQSKGCLPDSSSDIYPSYDLSYVYQ